MAAGPVELISKRPSSQSRSSTSALVRVLDLVLEHQLIGQQVTVKFTRVIYDH